MYRSDTIPYNATTMTIHIAEAMPPKEVGSLVADQFTDGAEFVHLQGLAFHRMEDAERADYIRTASQVIGRLTLSNSEPDSDVWRLDRATSPSINRIPYHTDSPYYQQPEKVVGFWNVKSSDDGGENVLLPVANLLDWASASPEARDLVDELNATPVEFAAGAHQATGPMLEADRSTARFDKRYILGEASAKLALRFSQLLEGQELPSRSIKLAEGDVLFFDNERLLHAREPYSNPDRVSYRVRILPTASPA